MNHLSRRAAAALIAGAFLVTACGGDDDTEADSAPAESTATTQASSAAFNDADVLFAQSMIPHHAQAVEMADLALAPEAAASAEVVALATAIKNAQDPEIQQMTAWLEQWGQPVEMPGMDDMEGMDDMHSMDGMMTSEQMASLAALSGPEFDAAWIEMMIAHHKGAIEMANTVKATGSNAEVLTLADEIIATQQAEIDQMRTLGG